MSLITTFQEIFDQLDKTNLLGSLRVKSWEKLNLLGLPNPQSEAFQYVSLRELLQTSFSFCQRTQIEKDEIFKAVLPESQYSHLVFIDGQFSQELSDLTALPSETVIIPLEQAMRTHGQFLQNHFAKTVKDECDPFALLNLCLHSQGVFFYLPPKTVVDVPVQCLFISTSSPSRISSPRIHFVSGKDSKMQVIVTSVAQDLGSAHLIVPAIEISLEERAELSLYHINEIPSSSHHFETIRANVKKDAKLQTFCMTEGAKTFRKSYRIFLKEERSQAELKGLWMLSQHHSAHTHVVIEHEAPHTQSMQLFKGVLKDHSRSSFEGKIFVRDVAQKTEAYQLNRNLILNSGPVANSKPNLEIFADDVKASHGATVSQMDPEQLFYLKTRGINEKSAQYLLIKAFCQELMNEVPYLSLQQKMQDCIESFIHKRGEKE